MTRLCLGDRDRRSEQRAQFLDAVLSAGERLVICSTGFDVRTRAEIPPAVIVSELTEAVEVSIGALLRTGRSSEAGLVRSARSTS